MRTNKALLPFGAHTLITHQYLKLHNIFTHVFIACKESQARDLLSALCATRDIPKSIFLCESESIFTPLHGILSAFSELEARGLLDSKNVDSKIRENNARDSKPDSKDSKRDSKILDSKTTDSNSIFFLSCDTPFVSAKTIQILCANARDYDIIFAKDSSRAHPLIGVWNARVARDLEKIVQKNENIKIMDAISHFETKSIFFHKDEFLNINTKNDYKHALEILGNAAK